MIEQFSPLHYGSMIKIPEIRPEISKAQIASALKKIGYKNVTIIANNIAKVYKGEKIHYRVCTQRPNSHNPWYSISKSKLDDLEKHNIDTIICIFFADEGGSSYEISYKIWKRDEIQKGDDWKKEIKKDNNKVLYRWNPSKEDEMTTLLEKGNGVAKGNI